ncbi:MAG: hypothetical protein HY446_01215 [Candidatus Niyogibacteria bacterium]|nr:hypothetical protein [Candidatus Niyogibacteria bacterium]
MLPNKKNIIRDIMPAGPVSAKPLARPAKEPEKARFGPPKKTILEPRTSRFFSAPKLPGLGGFSPLKYVMAGIFLYVVAVLAVDFFAKTIVTVVLKSEKLDVDSAFSAGAANSDIPAEAVLFEEYAEGSAKATGEKELNDRATGLVMIYNAYSSEKQQLVARTRFSTPDGKIFRIQKAVDVPGAKVVDGKIEPSSIEVDVVAENPGQEYNIGLSDFNIPGFEGTPKYDKFYGRSKTPMTGGFIGKATVVSEKDAEELVKRLEDAVRQKLALKMQSGLPEGFFVPEGASVYEIKTDKIEPAAGRQAEEFKVGVSGKLKAFFVRKEDAEKKIAEKYKDDPKFESVRVANFDELKLSAKNADFENLSFILSASGQARLVWGIDPGHLSEELASAAGAGDRLRIFDSYPQIRSAAVSHKPYWWPVFAKKARKILIQSSY